RCAISVRLKESFLTSQVSGGANVGQGKGEAERILIAHGAERKSPILKAGATAIPVVCRLRGGILDKIEGRIKANVNGRTQAAFGGAAITGQNTELVELVRTRNGIRSEYFSGNAQKSVAPAQKKITKVKSSE